MVKMYRKRTIIHFSLIVLTFQLLIANASSFNNTDVTTSSNGTVYDDTLDNYNFTRGKDESLFGCGIISLELDEYELFPNGTAYIELWKLTVNESFYILQNNSLFICSPSFDNDDTKEFVVKSIPITIVGLIISMISLFLHLIAFVLVPDLRNLPGWNLAALCASLLISYALIVILTTANVSINKINCIAIASSCHFFLLSSFMWMSIMSFDVFVSLLRATGSLRVSCTQFKLKRFVVYSLCAFGVAFIFAVLGLLSDILDFVPEEYKPEFEKFCWFSRKLPLTIFFAAPVIVLICLNFIFFLLSTYTIHNHKMKNNNDDHQSSVKRNYLMYFRLSVIMGITWTVGVVVTIVNDDWIFYLFTALNTLQGLFIFLAFTCSKKVKKYLRQKMASMKNRRPSEQTLTPTFQSYCYYANSIEKDLDKVVKINKEKIDTIVIHL